MLGDLVDRGRYLNGFGNGGVISVVGIVGTVCTIIVGMIGIVSVIGIDTIVCLSTRIVASMNTASNITMASTSAYKRKIVFFILYALSANAICILFLSQLTNYIV